MDKKTQHYNGLHFTRDDGTGYYLNSTIRERMHRYVWKVCNGEIPEGYEIHHIDHDKSNNDISNLELLEANEHRAHHARIQGIKNVESGFLEEIRGMTKEWHASEDGKKWHSEHYERCKGKLHAKKKFTCEQCGSEFEAEITGNNRFCSNGCKSAWRRDSGIDNEERDCVICGDKFVVNKYKKTKTCSRKCGSKLREKERKG